MLRAFKSREEQKESERGREKERESKRERERIDHVPDRVKILSVCRSLLLPHHLVSALHRFPLKEHKDFDGRRNLKWSSQGKLDGC